MTFEAESGEVIRFAPGELQLGRNLGSEGAVVLALGAPRETEQIEYYKACPECGTDTIQRPELDDGAGLLRISCSDCESVTEEISL